MMLTVQQIVEASTLLSIEEQLERLDALWEIVDVHAAPEFELTPEQRAELDRRGEEHRRFFERAISWEEGLARLAAIRDRQGPMGT